MHAKRLKKYLDILFFVPEPLLDKFYIRLLATLRRIESPHILRELGEEYLDGIRRGAFCTRMGGDHP